jgi:Alcohol dehydrogenase GroES-like domain
MEDMNHTMKAVSQDKLGGPEVLELVTIPRPEPGVSEILIRVHAAGVNPIDGAQRETGAIVGEPPFVLGWDVSGTVEAVGPGVTLYKPGDEVFGLLPFPQGHGAYAEYVIGPTRAFVPKPDRLDHVQVCVHPDGRADRLAGAGGHCRRRPGEPSSDRCCGRRNRAPRRTDRQGAGRARDRAGVGREPRLRALAGRRRSDRLHRHGLHGDRPRPGHRPGHRRRRLPRQGPRRPQARRHPGVHAAIEPPAARRETAAERGIPLAGVIVEADEVGMSALADLAAAGKLVPTVGATFPLEEARTASAMADVAASDGRFPLEEGGAAESGNHGPGKVVLTMV